MHGRCIVRGVVVTLLVIASGGLVSCAKEPQGQSVSLTDVDWSKALVKSEAEKQEKKREHLAWVMKGNGLAKEQRFSEALYCYTRAIDLAKSARNDQQEAKSAADQISWKRNLAEDLVAKGRMLEALGSPDAALRAFDEAAGNEPSSPYVVFGKADLLFHQQKYRDALTQYERDLHSFGKYGLLQKGLCLYYLHRKSEAIPCLQEALKASPHFRKPHYKAEAVLAELGI